MNDTEINKELTKKMINTYHFFEKTLRFAYNIKLDSHRINHLNSTITITPIYEFTKNVMWIK